MIIDTYALNTCTLESEVSGISEAFCISSDCPESIHLDIPAQSSHLFKCWGQIKTDTLLPLYQVPIYLLEAHPQGSSYFFHRVATTITDPSGFYYLERLTDSICYYQLEVLSRNPQYAQRIDCHILNFNKD